MTSWRPRRPARAQSTAQALRGLAAAALVSNDAFRVELQRRSARAIELRPADTDPGAPPGLWLRTAAADYLYYERQTSPFHQAHILLTLAARLLRDDGSRITLDPRLVPDLSPEMIRLILGDDAHVAETRDEPDPLVCQAMEHAHRRLPGPAARRLLRELQPLHATLLDVVPPAAHGQAPGRPGPRVRLCQAVVEIREVMLALRPYAAPRDLAAARTAVLPAELAADELSAVLEASVLASAILARKSGAPVVVAAAGATGWQFVPGRDLHSEAVWLVRVVRAFQRDTGHPAPAGNARGQDHNNDGIPERR